jgi:hypothetical protein
MIKDIPTSGLFARSPSIREKFTTVIYDYIVLFKETGGFLIRGIKMKKAGVFLTLFAALVLSAGPIVAAGCGGGAGLAQTVPCSEPSAFTFDTDLISVNAGGGSLMELEELSGETPGTYSTARPAAVIKQGICYTALSGFSEIMGRENKGSIVYQLSPNGSDWYFFDGSRWESAATEFDANTAEEIDRHIAAYSEKIGPGTLYIKAFLVSDGSQKVQLESITINYEA